MGAHFYSGDVKNQNTQKFHQKHHFYATILARRCQTRKNGFWAMSNSKLHKPRSRDPRVSACMAKSKINLLKQLAGTQWGQDKETMLLTYKAVGQSTLEYGAPIWVPAISDTHWNNLQAFQNQALRAATGNLLMASQEHLHAESKVMPLRAHSNLLT